LRVPRRLAETSPYVSASKPTYRRLRSKGALESQLHVCGLVLVFANISITSLCFSLPAKSAAV
jgi:hypothetical protein